MNTVLVIAPRSELAAAVRAALDPSLYRVIEQSGLSEDDMRLSATALDACICEVDLTAVQAIRALERLRRILPDCPLVLYTAAPGLEWEEEAYVLGASQILVKPVRARLLQAVLERLLAGKAAPELSAAKPPLRAGSRPAAEASQIPAPTLELLRNYSSILLHDFNAESLLKEFLLSLRKIIGVNRAAIFLRQPAGTLADTPEPVRHAGACTRRAPSGWRRDCWNILNCRWSRALAGISSATDGFCAATARRRSATRRCARNSTC